MIIKHTIKNIEFEKLTILTILFISSIIWRVNAQNTVGLISKKETATTGYNLIFPHNQEKVFLVDNDGQVVHYWDDEDIFVPGNGVYLLPNGNLLKCKRTEERGDPIFAGGAGAIVDIISWEGNLLHSYALNNDRARLHHDVAYLPNGNVLMIAWERFSKEEAIEAGRDTALLSQDFLLSEMILEWNPISNNIVWEWHVWDHLIQDRFPNKSNFGNVEQNSGKININYDEHDGHPDWLHINAIDYNPVTDQFVLSVPYFNEFWVIDHSTSEEEAKKNEGGNSGRGGEILFRFGNDKTYLNEPNEQLFYFQHDVQWIAPNAKEEEENFGKIALFNNRLPNATSTGILMNTIDKTNNKFLNPVFAPNNLIENIYSHPENIINAYSNGLSSIQVFENNHVLMFAGRFGYAYELDENGEVVWEYRVPLKAGKPVSQGTLLEINDNITFTMARYSSDYSGLQGKDLTPKGLLEEMEFEEVITSLDEETEVVQNIKVFPNPVKDILHFESNYVVDRLKIFNSEGQLVKEFLIDDISFEIDTKSFKSGLYFIIFNGKRLKFIKQ